MAADERLVDQTTTAARSVSGGGDDKCQAREHSVTLDLRSAFADQFIITCSGDDDSRLLERIEKSLNTAFPYMATEWDGTAIFESFQFDFTQALTNVEGFRRSRELAQVCPDRPHDCPSFFDSCRFSCGLLRTTSCNGMALSSIEQIDNYLSAAATQALRALNMECLGFESELIALVRVNIAL